MNRQPARALSACVLALTVAAATTATPARADLVTYQMVLRANTIGPDVPVFGLSSLPGSPFVGTFTLDESGLAANALVSADVVSLDLWIGSQHFDASDVWTDMFATDAAGSIDLNAGIYLALDPQNSPVSALVTSNGAAVDNIDWVAGDGPNGCTIDASPPYTGITAGRCIGGLPGTVRVFELSRTAVPEPATPALVLAAALGAWLARRGWRRGALAPAGAH